MSTVNSVAPLGFLEAPFSRDLSTCDVAVLGVPYDLATTGRAGTRDGPTAIRQASWINCWQECHWPWRFRLRDRIRLIDYGDIEFDTADSSHMVEVLQGHASDILSAGKKLLSLGGDHFIALPLLREQAAVHGAISLIHFDAHCDTEPIEDVYNHGNMFSQARKEGVIDPAHSVQVGLRTEYAYEDYPFTVLEAGWVSGHKPSEASEVIQRVVGSRPAYVTFDIDCLDPAYAPGTGTPVAGGLSTATALEIIRGLVGSNIVGMDVVEVAPSYDHSEVTALAAASIASELLHVIAAEPSDRPPDPLPTIP